jgi:hypothetical protein
MCSLTACPSTLETKYIFILLAMYQLDSLSHLASLCDNRLFCLNLYLSVAHFFIRKNFQQTPDVAHFLTVLQFMYFKDADRHQDKHFTD